jgi:hypothetical protein
LLVVETAQSPPDDSSLQPFLDRRPVAVASVRANSLACGDAIHGT